MDKKCKKKFFVIESDWFSSEKDQHSILPLLECIKGVEQDFDYYFRTANTKEELIYCLHKFKSLRFSKDEPFNVLVICGHGSKGIINIGTGTNLITELTLNNLSDICSEVAENLLEDVLIHFDSCYVLQASNTLLTRFAEKTGATAISGFTKEADFINSYALELILFRDLMYSNNAKKTLLNFKDKHSTGLGKINGFEIWA